MAQPTPESLSSAALSPQSPVGYNTAGMHVAQPHGAPPHRSNDDPAYKVIRKRNRIPLSCAPCRNRKLKCNRAMPCENCVKRNEAGSCSYATPGSRRKATVRAAPNASPDDMQNRIDRLEGLVLTLMANPGGSNPGQGGTERSLSMASLTQNEYTPSDNTDEAAATPDDVSETDHVAKSLGVMHMFNDKISYIGDAHWASVLADIAEVRNFYNEHKKEMDDQLLKVKEHNISISNAGGMAPSFCLGARNLPTFPELLAALPGKDAVDKMVDRYFEDYDPAIHILHPPTWRQRYEAHWANPTATDPAFLGQLFAIAGLAMQSWNRTEDEPYEYRGRTIPLAASFRTLTSQCLAISDFHKPVNYLVETLVLHLHGEQNKKRDGDFDLWVLTGMVVRISMRLGLHRDGKHYPNLSPFLTEMRRRVWAFIRQSDILYSFQVGLPSMIRSGDCDTDLPRNIWDEELLEESPSLPSPRPPSTFTPVSYMIAKSTLAITFGKIIEIVHSVHVTPYEDILQLDRELREAYYALPELLHVKAEKTDGEVGPLNTLTMRYNISMLYHKALCVLHRAYLQKARESPRYLQSRRQCIDSSMHLLRYQRTLHFESKPSGRFRSAKWYVDSIATSDFLLAATLVCLDLWHSAQALHNGQSTGDKEMWGTDKMAEEINALQQSREIWMESRDRSIDSYKASEYITLMLNKANHLSMSSANGPIFAAHPTGTIIGAQQAQAQAQTQASQNPQKQADEHTAAITLGMLRGKGGDAAPGSGQGQLSHLQGYNANGNGNGNGNANVNVNVNPATAQGLAMDGNSLSAAQNFNLDAGGMNAPSPFNFFASGLDMPAQDVNWAAWDSYIASSDLNPQSSLTWPVNGDTGMDGQEQGGMFANPFNGS